MGVFCYIITTHTNFKYFLKKPMLKFILFIPLIALGAFMVIRTHKIVDIFGHNAWAESKFGIYGGSTIFYKLFGLAIIILSAMMVTGWLEAIVASIFGSLVGGGRG